VRARASGLVQRVIQKSTRAENARCIVAETIGNGAAAPHVTGCPEAAWQEMEELLRWTAARITRVHEVVIRQFSSNASDIQLQFVLHQGPAYEAFRGEVVQRWLWPVKPRGGPALPHDADHPVLGYLGDLSEDREVYARRIGEEDFYVYLALLPWCREARATAALGIYRQEFDESLYELLVDVHRFAVEEVAELPLPQIPSRVEATGPGHTVLEYDWIVTDSYVGADRRRAPTPFLNRFAFIGRRKRIPSRAARTSDSYVDRLAPWVRRYAVVYLVLSAIDTGLTWWCVRRGIVDELNPLLRPFVLHRPSLFLMFKNLLAVLVFLVVARFQQFRIGRYILGAPLLAFALLDAYWLHVLY
jgi:hypothetical protein